MSYQTEQTGNLEALLGKLWAALESLTPLLSDPDPQIRLKAAGQFAQLAQQYAAVQEQQGRAPLFGPDLLRKLGARHALNPEPQAPPSAERPSRILGKLASQRRGQ